MDFMNTFRLALRALARNKMRSSLTMLGIIIGVGAVIAVVSIGQGAEYLIQEGIQSMGTNAVFISAGSATQAGVRMGGGQTKTLTKDDMEAILREVNRWRAQGLLRVATMAQVAEEVLAGG